MIIDYLLRVDILILTAIVAESIFCVKLGTAVNAEFIFSNYRHSGVTIC